MPPKTVNEEDTGVWYQSNGWRVDPPMEDRHTDEKLLPINLDGMVGLISYKHRSVWHTDIQRTQSVEVDNLVDMLKKKPYHMNRLNKTVTCPKCGQKREIAPSTYSQIKKGHKSGLCRSCSNIKRRSIQSLRETA